MNMQEPAKAEPNMRNQELAGADGAHLRMRMDGKARKTLSTSTTKRIRRTSDCRRR